MLAAACTFALVLLAPVEGPSTFHRLSLDSETLCAAGVTAVQVSPLVEALNASQPAQSGALETADTTCAQANQTVRQLRSLVKKGQATSAQVQELAEAKLAQQAAAQVRDGLLDSLFDAGTAGLSETVRAQLATARGNRRWKFPVEFLLVDRPQVDWVALRNNLSQERIMVELQEELDSTVALALSTARGNPTVAAASTRLNSSLAAVVAAWDAAFVE